MSGFHSGKCRTECGTVDSNTWIACTRSAALCPIGVLWITLEP